MAPYRSSEGALGEVVRAHPWNASSSLLLIGAGFTALPLTLLALPRGDASDWTPMSYVGLAILVIVAPAIGIGMLVSAYRLRGNGVLVCERGLWHRWAGAETSVPWSEIASIRSSIVQNVRNGVAGPVHHDHRVTMRDGTELKITHGFDDVDGLMVDVRSRTREARLEHARALLDEKKPVPFGPLALTRRALEHGRLGSLPIARVGSVQVLGGMLSVYVPGEREAWITVRSAEVPNEDLLEPLVDELVAERREKRAKAAKPD